MSMAGRRSRFVGLIATASLAVGVGCHEVHFDPKVVEGQIEIYDDLFAVAVADQNRAVAVGDYGAIYVTEDGGGTWFKRRAGTDELLYDVSMAGADRGWAIGQRGLVLRTRDGGATWQVQATNKVEQGAHLFSVHAIDANTAWAVGEWGTRLFTDDGGKSWQDLSLTIDTEHPQYVWLSPPEQEKVRRGEKVYEDVTLNKVDCRPPPSKMCWMIGEFGYIFWSDSRGLTWRRATIVGTEELAPVLFRYNETEFREEDVERIKAFVEDILDSEHLNVEVEAFAIERELREFGGADDPTELFDILDARALGVRTIVEETGILSDRLRMRGTPPWDYEDFLEDDPEFLNRYLDSQRAETPMVTVAIAQNPFLFDIRFADDQNGVIAGLGGVVLFSSDGGKTWAYGDSGIKHALYAVAYSQGEIVAVGEKGHVRISRDSGRTWGPAQHGAFPEIFTFMRDAQFSPSGGLGLIVGQRGLVLRSRDEGRSWQQVLPKAKLASSG